MAATASRRESSGPLQWWLTLFVRYWTGNMHAWQRHGIDWPGFGHTAAERREMKEIRKDISNGEMTTWRSCFLLFALILAYLIAHFGYLNLLAIAGGARELANEPAALSVLAVGFYCLAFVTAAIPFSAILATVITGLIFRPVPPMRPSIQSASYYAQRIWFQFTRFVGIFTLILLPVFVVVPNNTKLIAAARIIAPVEIPLILLIVFSWFFADQVRR